MALMPENTPLVYLKRAWIRTQLTHVNQLRFIDELQRRGRKDVYVIPTDLEAIRSQYNSKLMTGFAVDYTCLVRTDQQNSLY